jgi:hypothetical protein
MTFNCFRQLENYSFELSRENFLQIRKKHFCRRPLLAQSAYFPRDETGVSKLSMSAHSAGAYTATLLRRYDMNGRFQMQGGKNWILPKEMNVNRFFWDSHWLEIWSNHFCPSMGPNGVSVAMDSGDGKCNERGWACTPHPHQLGLILPSYD